ncbi:hypothetical protein [Nocardioides massiliensis]|uniref:PhnB protein n=1 Tax=Nocardioides massiliensis TaxID=1325935 RepID=A0ABT9NKJ1_9ACTN|nr:hypothetical protein [Nocardioides massiliensis]MDP9820930.1 PhnB protein [Nocardioides massiliensis]
MAITLNPYVHLAGAARPAPEQYAALFGGSPQIMTYGDAGEEGEHAGLVMHGFLRTHDGMQLMVSDRLPGETVASGDGEVHVPLEQQMWGDVFGQCRDRFGVVWLINIGQ